MLVSFNHGLLCRASEARATIHSFGIDIQLVSPRYAAPGSQFHYVGASKARCGEAFSSSRPSRLFSLLPGLRYPNRHDHLIAQSLILTRAYPSPPFSSTKEINGIDILFKTGMLSTFLSPVSRYPPCEVGLLGKVSTTTIYCDHDLTVGKA